MDVRVRDHARLRHDHLDAVDDASDLVLPATAGGQRLLEAQHLVEQLPLREVLADDPRDRGGNHRAHDTGGSQAASLGNGGQGRQLDSASKVLQRLSQGTRPRSAARPGRQARQRQGRLGQGETAGGFAVVQQVLEPANLDANAQVDRADADDRLVDHADVRLDRRLSVEVDRRVHHAAAPLERIGGRVGPAPADIEPRRRAGPDDFIAAQHAARRRRLDDPAADDRPLQRLKRRLLRPL